VPSRDEILASYTVFTAVDRRYLRIFALWLEKFERSGYLPCLRVATFDAESARFVRARGISHVAIDERIRDPRQLFVARLNEIAALVAAGRKVIHSDADAFWLSPDLPALIREDCDLQISVGHGIPKTALDEWGFTLCCGFFIAQDSPAMKRFLATWIDRSSRLEDDQIALNDLLLEHDLRWERDEGLQTVGSCPPLGLTVGAISHDVISRDDAGPGVQIYHPYLSSTSESNKLLQLKARIEPTPLRRISARLRLALNVSAWPEILRRKARQALQRVRRTLPTGG
jgi:Nucleotide-diphospho-sugar transferase